MNMQPDYRICNDIGGKGSWYSPHGQTQKCEARFYTALFRALTNIMKNMVLNVSAISKLLWSQFGCLMNWQFNRSSLQHLLGYTKRSGVGDMITSLSLWPMLMSNTVLLENELRWRAIACCSFVRSPPAGAFWQFWRTRCSRRRPCRSPTHTPLSRWTLS